VVDQNMMDYSSWSCRIRLGAIAYHNPHEIFDVLNVPTAVCNKQTVGDEDAEKQKAR